MRRYKKGVIGFGLAIVALLAVGFLDLGQPEPQGFRFLRKYRTRPALRKELSGPVTEGIVIYGSLREIDREASAELANLGYERFTGTCGFDMSVGFDRGLFVTPRGEIVGRTLSLGRVRGAKEPQVVFEWFGRELTTLERLQRWWRHVRAGTIW